MANNPSEDISGQIKSAGSKLGNAATRKASKKARQAVKKAAVKTAKNVARVAKLAIKTIASLLSAIFSPMGIAIAIVLFIVLVANYILDSDQVNKQKYQLETSLATARYTSANTIAAVFYEKYADQSFYYVLSAPDDDVDEYSGKSYEDFEEAVEETTSIKQSSTTNIVQDIDNYEDNIKLSAGMLSVLDTKLNEAGSTGYYFPEQFIKLLAIDYSSDSCNLTRITNEDGTENEIDISGCKLKDLLSIGVEKTDTKTVQSGEKTDDGTMMTQDYCLNTLEGSWDEKGCTYEEKVEYTDETQEATGKCTFDGVNWTSNDDDTATEKHSCTNEEWVASGAEISYTCALRFKDDTQRGIENNWEYYSPDREGADCSGEVTDNFYIKQDESKWKEGCTTATGTSKNNDPASGDSNHSYGSCVSQYDAKAQGQYNTYKVTISAPEGSSPSRGSTYTFTYQAKAAVSKRMETEVLSNGYDYASEREGSLGWGGDVLVSSGEKVESVSDYGLGSLVHYQAYYQPSRIKNYKIEDTVIVDDEWEFGDEGTPYKVVNYSKLSDEEQEEIIEKYKNYTLNNNKKTSTTTEGVLYNSDDLGLYPVEDEIKYKDWAPAFNDVHYDVSNWENWGVSDVDVSTGVLDTEIVYAIDQAMVYFKQTPLNLKVSQTWTDLETAVHEQTSTYLKDYEASSTVKKACENADHNGIEQCNYKVSGDSTAEALKKVYNSKGEFIGYTNETIHWTNGKLASGSSKKVSSSKSTNSRTESPTYEVGTAENTNYCKNKYDPTTNKNAYTQCLASSHKGSPVTTKTDIYSYSFDYEYSPGYWEVHLVRDTNGSSIDETIKLTDNSDYAVSCHISESYENEQKSDDEIRNLCGDWSKSGVQSVVNAQNDRDPQNKSMDNVYKKSGENVWWYTPSYLFHISAHTEGTLQVYLVSHSGTNLTSSSDSLDYLKGYIKNYEAYVPYTNPTFQCTNLEGTRYFGSTFTSVNDCDCTVMDDRDEQAYCMANPTQTYKQTNMSRFGTSNMNVAQIEKTNEVLGISTDLEENDYKYTSEVVTIPTSISKTTTEALNEITKDTTWTKAIEKAHKKYGIDSALLKSMIATARKEGIDYVACEDSCTLENVFIFDEVNNGQRVTRDITLTNTGTPEEIVGSMAAKMQRLLEDTNGNVLLALLEYNLGGDTATKVLEVYADASGFPLEEIVENEYDTGWYHYINEVLENTTKYNVSPLSTANKGYIQDIVTYLGKSTNVKWTRRPEAQSILDRVKDAFTNLFNFSINSSSTKVFLWQKSSIYDRVDSSTSKNVYDPTITTALYKMQANNAEGYRKYWKLLTGGQKGEIIMVNNETGEIYTESSADAISRATGLASGTYSYEEVEEKCTNGKGQWICSDYISTAAYSYDELGNMGDGLIDFTNVESAKKVTYKYNDNSIKNVIVMALTFDDDTLYQDRDILSGDYWLSKFGKLNIKPDYTKIVGRSLEAPTEEYTTVKAAGASAKSYYGSADKEAWVFETEKGAEIKTITNTGTLVNAENGTVEVYIEKYDTTIRYTGLDEIYVEVDEVDSTNNEIKNKVLGTSSGTISVYVYHNGGYYDMEEFLREASSSLSIGSGVVTGFLGGACLDAETSKMFWDEYVNAVLDTDGGAFYNCTRFTNFMISIRWGSDFYRPVYGDGHDKVDNIVSVFSDLGVEKIESADDLPDEAYNLAFSYSDESYGHTGWIDEVHRDDSMEGGGYVIVSEGNVGSNSLIRWRQQYTWQEWYDKVGQHCSFAYNPNAAQTEDDSLPDGIGD